MSHEEGQPDYGQAGRSARREAARRRERRMRRAAERKARLLGWLRGPSAAEKRELADERAWSTGAGGEELLAAYLDKRAPQASIL
ncbi:MAG TPA: hypothetical protein VED41_09030, partial [Solirubrobacteraceae bacterium]|nr:hypothetical protein [Solirubrobacteraceae bacterium]